MRSGESGTKVLSAPVLEGPGYEGPFSVERVFPGVRLWGAHPIIKGILGMIRRYFALSPLPMRIVLLGAFLFSVLFVTTKFMHKTIMGLYPDRFDWLAIVPIPLLNYFTWAMLFPLIYMLTQRWPLTSKPLAKQVVKHVLVCLVLGMLQEAFTSTIYLGFLANAGRFEWSAALSRDVLLQLPAGVLERAMEYWLLVIVLMFIESNRKMNEKLTQMLKLQNRLQEAELGALKQQLKPHFLFNVLNTVSSLMEHNVAEAQDVLVRLASFLRSTLKEDKVDRVPLLHELDAASHYLEIEAVRFKDRLRVEYSIANECHHALVPNLILQPLVENAVKHGSDTSHELIRIEIVAERIGDRLRLSVVDDGRGCTDVDNALSTGGIGLQNVGQRIALMYGPKGTFHVRSPDGRGFIVTLEMPFEIVENFVRQSE